jgi:hypothetical protein
MCSHALVKESTYYIHRELCLMDSHTWLHLRYTLVSGGWYRDVTCILTHRILGCSVVYVNRKWHGNSWTTKLLPPLCITEQKQQQTPIKMSVSPFPGNIPRKKVSDLEIKLYFERNTIFPGYMCKVKYTLDVTYSGFVRIISRFESCFRDIFPGVTL